LKETFCTHATVTLGDAEKPFTLTAKPKDIHQPPFCKFSPYRWPIVTGNMLIDLEDKVSPVLKSTGARFMAYYGRVKSKEVECKFMRNTNVLHVSALISAPQLFNNEPLKVQVEVHSILFNVCKTFWFTYKMRSSKKQQREEDDDSTGTDSNDDDYSDHKRHRQNRVDKAFVQNVRT
jgi:hypothetical protein